MPAGDLQASYFVLAHAVLDGAGQLHRREAGLAQEIGRARLHRLDRHVGIAVVGEQQHRGSAGQRAEQGHPADAVLARGLGLQQHRAVAHFRQHGGGVAAFARVPVLHLRVGPARVQHVSNCAAELGGFVDDQEAHGEAPILPGPDALIKPSGQRIMHALRR
jgi:hypothetical protein